MASHPPIYGLDLITDAVGDTLDPSHNAIVAIGLSSASGTEVLDGTEPDLLQEIDCRLASLPQGVVATWNGSLLDLPLIAMRAVRLDLNLGLTIRADRRSSPVSPIQNLEHAVCAGWHDHQHLDLRRIYANNGRRLGRRKVDQESLIPPVNDLVQRDPGKDASLARRLSERRWSQARKFVDRMPAQVKSPESGARTAILEPSSAPDHRVAQIIL